MPTPDNLPTDCTLSYIAAAPSTIEDATLNATLPTIDARPGGGEAGAAGGGPAYDLLRVIGRGGMGEVWEAVQVSLGRVVAIKRARLGDSMEDESNRSRRAADFTREAVVAGRLEHPNIVPVHDLGMDGEGNPILAMKLVEGSPWNDLLREDLPKLPPAELLARHVPILIGMAQAVAFAHSRGVVHRDLKPAQVMIGEFGEVMLTDWGLAIVTDRARTPLPSAVRIALPTTETASSPSGTPALMAPEQTRDSAAGIGTWTDIYLLGGTLYFLLTATFPHEAPSAREAFLRASGGQVDPPSRRAPGRDVPPELEALALRCLEPDPAKRPATAAEVLDGLRDFLSGTSRRKESQALSAEAASRLSASAHPTYEALESVWATLSRAGELWAGNPALGALRERTLSLYAQEALEARDLKLARLQAKRMAAGDAQRALLRQVDAAEARIAADARARRRAKSALAVAVAVIIIGGAAFTVSLNAARTQAEKERDAATAARDLATKARGRSDSLIDFMLTDLRRSLTELQRVDPLIRVDLLKDVAARALDTYKAAAAEPHSEREAETIVNGLVAVHGLLMESQNLPLALEAADAAAAIAEAEAKRFPASADKWRANWASIRGKAASIHALTGDAAAREAADKDRLETLRALVEKSPRNAENLQRLMSALGDDVKRRIDAGDYESALAALPGAMAMRDRILALDPDNADARRYYCSMQIQRGDALMGLTKFAEAVEEYRAAGKLIDALEAEGHGNDSTRWEYATALNREGIALRRMGRIAEVRTVAEERLRRIRAMAEAKPTDMELRAEVGISAINLGDALEALDEFEGALGCYEEARALMVDLNARHPENQQWTWILAGARYKLGSLNWSMSRPAESLGPYLEAIDMMGPIDPATTPLHWVNVAAVARAEAARAYLALGEVEPARALLKQLFAETEAAQSATSGAAELYRMIAFEVWANEAKVRAHDGDRAGAFDAMRNAVRAGYSTNKVPRDLRDYAEADPEGFAAFMEELCTMPR